MAINWIEILNKEGYNTVKSMLEDMYIKKNLSSTIIAKKLNISIPTVLTLLKEEGIKMRDRGGCNHKKGERYIGKNLHKL